MTLGLAMSHSAAVESRHTAHNTERTTSAALTHTIGSGFTHGRFLYHHPQYLDFFMGWIRAFWSSQGPGSLCPRQLRLFELFWETFQSLRKCYPLPELCWEAGLCQEPTDTWRWFVKEQAGCSVDTDWLMHMPLLRCPSSGNYKTVTKLVWIGCQLEYGG